VQFPAWLCMPLSVLTYYFMCFEINDDADDECVSVMAQDKSTSSDPAERAAAVRLGKASINVSIAGIIVGTVFLIVLISLNATVLANNKGN